MRANIVTATKARYYGVYHMSDMGGEVTILCFDPSEVEVKDIPIRYSHQGEKIRFNQSSYVDCHISGEITPEIKGTISTVPYTGNHSHLYDATLLQGSKSLGPVTTILTKYGEQLVHEWSDDEYDYEFFVIYTNIGATPKYRVYRNGEIYKSGSCTRRTLPSKISCYNLPPLTRDFLFLNKEYVEEKLERLDWYADKHCSLTYGDVTKQAADATKALDINTIGYGKDMLSLFDLAKQTRDLVNGDFSPKTIANAYLLAKYAFSNMFHDTEEIASAIDVYEPIDHICRTRASDAGSFRVGELDYTCIFRSLIIYDGLEKEYRFMEDLLKQADRKARSFGYALTWENLWDFVPYSFMVDWFLPLGDVFAHKDDINYIKSLPIHGCTCSRQYTAYGTPNQLGLWSSQHEYMSGKLKFQIYVRTAMDYAPTPPLRVKNPQGFSGHWLEAAAITIQRKN